MLGDAVLLADDGVLRVLLLDAATDELLGARSAAVTGVSSAFMSGRMPV